MCKGYSLTHWCQLSVHTSWYAFGHHVLHRCWRNVHFDYKIHYPQWWDPYSFKAYWFWKYVIRVFPACICGNKFPNEYSSYQTEYCMMPFMNKLCKRVPFCVDNTLELAFELADNYVKATYLCFLLSNVTQRHQNCRLAITYYRWF